MKLKKLLSVLLIMTMVLSICSVAQASNTDYLVPVNDFSLSTNLGFSCSNAVVSLTTDAGESVLKMNKPYTSSANFYSSKYDTTGKNGVVYEFDIKQLSNGSNPSGLTAYMNGAGPLLIITADGSVKYTDLSAVQYTLNKDSWYTISIKVSYESKNIYGIIKDANGNVVHRKVFRQSGGYIQSEMVAKSGSSLDFKTGSSVIGDIFYIDNFSVRALETDDMATVPVSTTGTVVAEDYDNLSPNPVILTGGWSAQLYNGKGWGYNDKGYIIGGKSGEASIKETFAGSEDKYLEFNLDASTDSYIDYMYYNTLNKNNYIQEVTFKVEENVQYMDYRYRINKNNLSDVFVARLDFQSDKVYLGSNVSPVNAEFDFVPGTIYTAKAYYAWDSNKGKIEITDGSKSLVLHGALNSNANTADTVEAPYIRFTSDNTKITGRKVSIYNNNIYTTDERSCELKTRYSNLKLSKSAFEVGTIIASVDVESNASFANCVNGAATLYLAVYENGELAELKAVQVSPENKTFSVENNIGANDTSVKAMLWNVADGTLTPLFVSEELAKQ